MSDVLNFQLFIQVHLSDEEGEALNVTHDLINVLCIGSFSVLTFSLFF